MNFIGWTSALLWTMDSVRASADIGPIRAGNGSR